MEQQSISSDLIRGHIDTIILYSLTDSDKYAQQISDCIESKSNNEYKINQATLYSSLKRLETLKHVSSYWNDADNSGRRKFFHLTEQGKQVVENNLSSWSYSKQIIDRLMDCETITSNNESKIVYVVKNDAGTTPNVLSKKEQESIDVYNNSTQITAIETATEKNNSINDCEKFEQIDTLDAKVSPKNEQIEESDKDFNFRLILNGLIKTNTTNKKPSQKTFTSEKMPVVENQLIDNKPAFNDTLQVDYHCDDYPTGSKVDFGDLKIKAAQEGYKIRVSSKESALPDGTLKINKLNFIAALLTLFLSAIEFIPVFIYCKPYIEVSLVNLIIFGVIVCAYPVFSLIKYVVYPKVTTTKRIYPDSILTCAIIIFNLLLVLFATTFLVDMDFTSKVNLVKYIYTPVCLMIDAIAFTTLKLLLVKNKWFYRTK